MKTILCLGLLAALVALPGSGAAVTANAPFVFRTTSVQTPSETQSLGAADLNGDGKADLLGTFTDSNDVQIFAGTANGPSRSSVGQGLRVNAWHPVAADLNRDGWPDLIVADKFESEVAVGIRRNGRFESTAPLALPASDYLGAADVDGDGNPDVVSSGCVSFCGGADVGVAFGDGAGEFPRTASDALDAVPSAIGDVNGDGRADWLAASCTGADFTTKTNCRVNAIAFLSRGDGTFTPLDPIPLGIEATSGFVQSAAGDVNGDGKLDFVVAADGGWSSQNTALAVLLGRGDGTFDRVSGPVVRTLPFQLILADVDNDGRSDAILAGYGQRRVWLVRSAPTGFLPPRDLGDFSSYLTTGDFDGNGRVDIAMGGQSAISTRLNFTGRCLVPSLAFVSARAAGTVARAHGCRLGRVSRAHADVAVGEIASQRPGRGRVLPLWSPIRVTISLGPKR